VCVVTVMMGNDLTPYRVVGGCAKCAYVFACVSALFLKDESNIESPKDSILQLCVTTAVTV